MRFCWVQNRVQNVEFAIYWPNGEQNRLLHQTPTHINMRPTYLHTGGHLAQVSMPDCRGVLILNSGLTRGQSCDSCPTRGLASLRELPFVTVAVNLIFPIVTATNNFTVYRLLIATIEIFLIEGAMATSTRLVTSRPAWLTKERGVVNSWFPFH
jgi:hypothetical protein